MVKQTQTIRWMQPTKFLYVFDHSVALALKGLTLFTTKINILEMGGTENDNYGNTNLLLSNI